MKYFIPGVVHRHVLVLVTMMAGRAITASAQHVFTPADPALRPDRIATGVDTIVVLTTPRDSTERPTATVIRSVERIGAGSNSRIRVVTRTESPGRATNVDTLEADAATLHALRTTSAGGSATSWELTFAGPEMRGTVTSPDSGKRPINATIAEPFFDGGTIEPFLAAFAFGADSIMSVASLNPPGTAVRRFNLRAVGSETVATAAGPVDCIVARRGSATEYLISRTDGHLIAMRWKLADGTTVRRMRTRDLRPR